MKHFLVSWAMVCLCTCSTVTVVSEEFEYNDVVELLARILYLEENLPDVMQLHDELLYIRCDVTVTVWGDTKKATAIIATVADSYGNNDGRATQMEFSKLEQNIEEIAIVGRKLGTEDLRDFIIKKQGRDEKDIKKFWEKLKGVGFHVDTQPGDDFVHHF